MKLQPTISKTIFYSFLFAIGGSPTLAMLVIYGQNYNPDFFMTAFMSLSCFDCLCLNPGRFYTKQLSLMEKDKSLS